MQKRSREVVITGVGVACNMGDDLPAIESQLREGRGTPFERWAPAVEAGCRCEILGLYHGELTGARLGIDKQQARFMGRSSLLALRAARLAVEQSGISRRDMAIVFGSGAGDVQTHREIQARLNESGSARRVGPTVIPRLMASTVSANLANVFGITGPSFSVSAACAGGAYNLIMAAKLIEDGHSEAAITGGAESADIHFHSGFDSMRAYNSQDNDRPERASRPYAEDRAGFIFAEGAGAMVLESRAHATARGARILGVLRGYGMSSDGAGEMVAPSPEGAETAIRRALEHAGLGSEAIDYINTHGTSTPLGDLSEVAAIRRVFSGRHVPYSSTKGYTGHTVSGAGAIEAIFTWAMLREGWIAPSLNAAPLDPALRDYPPVLTPTRGALDIALSNSFGFGGTNVTLVLGKEPT